MTEVKKISLSCSRRVPEHWQVLGYLKKRGWKKRPGLPIHGRTFFEKEKEGIIHIVMVPDHFDYRDTVMRVEELFQDLSRVEEKDTLDIYIEMVHLAVVAMQ